MYPPPHCQASTHQATEHRPGSLCGSSAPASQAHQPVLRTSTSPDPAQLARQTWCTLNIMILFLAFLAMAGASDLNRQSIIFNENTPDVFYCPQVQPQISFNLMPNKTTSCKVVEHPEQEKPISIDRMLVKSRPMKKLCEHEGRYNCICICICICICVW